ncbi:MAG: hypothetical protein SF052_24190 [Bacteroidia bacterium]|nr:hypothetical protein [Bacteroidia bacterium]
MIVRSALMISTPLYEDPKISSLVATPQEFLALREVLNNPKIGGFGRISSLTESDCAKAKKEIVRFFQNREVHELLLLYINGFELISEGDRLYFGDSKTDLQSLEDTTVSARFVYDAMKDCAADQKMLIIDCFSREEMDAQKKQHKEMMLAEFSRATQSFVLTSQDTLGTSITPEGLVNPKFTASLTEGLKTGDADLDQRGYISEDELFLYIYKRMNQNGIAPNLFLNSTNQRKRIRVATNIKFVNIPVFVQEDSAVNFGRFFRLVQKRIEASGQEKKSLRKIVRRQPEITFLRRIGGALLTGIVTSAISGMLMGIPLGKAILIAVLVLIAIITQALIARKVFS